jgi:hypothetical protein
MKRIEKFTTTFSKRKPINCYERRNMSELSRTRHSLHNCINGEKKREIETGGGWLIIVKTASKVMYHSP